MTIRARSLTARLAGTVFAGSLMIGAVAVPATAHADTVGGGWSFATSSVPAGVASGGELAVDPSRNSVFVTDSDFVMMTKGGTDVTLKLHEITPKVSVVNTASKRPVRSIDFSGQPWGVMPFGNVPVVPTPQVPDGIGLDTVHGKVITSNSHANGITVVDMKAKTTSAANLISLPLAHPMGVAVTDAGRAYVALNADNSVAVVNTVTGKQVGSIKNIFMPSFLDVDDSRHRLYVGNADYNDKKVNYLTVVDTRTDKVIKKIATPSNSRPKVDHATGLVWAASFDTGKVTIIDPDSLRIVGTIDTKTTPAKVAIDSQRGLLYTSNLQKKTITVIDTASRKVIATVSVKGAPHTVAVDERTGTVYASQHQNGKLTVLTVTRR